MLTRREMLRKTAHLGVAAAVPPLGPAAEPEGVEVNDMQSQLNATRVRRIVKPRSIDQVQASLREARREGHAVCVAGGRHAMGGQQFGREAILFDTRELT